MDSSEEWYVIKNEKKPAWNQLNDHTGLRDEDKGQVTPFDFHESKPVEYYLHMIGHIPDQTFYFPLWIQALQNNYFIYIL